MRSKLPNNAFFEFWSHEKRADQEIQSLLEILTSWSKIWPPKKVEFRSHEIWPPDPESLEWPEHLKSKDQKIENQNVKKKHWKSDELDFWCSDLFWHHR